MGARVRRVRVLIEVGVPRVGCREPARLADRAVGPSERIGQHDLRAERADDAFAFERDLVRHDELRQVATDRTDHRERDAGVAAGRIEDDRAVAEAPLLLGGDDHPQGGPVLDAAARIRRLDLRPQLAAQPRADAAQRSAHTLAHEIRGEGHA